MVIAFHFAEHLAQMFELYVLHLPRRSSLGLLGLWQPNLVHSEWLHYGHALYMLLGMYYFRPKTNSKIWWKRAIALQQFHHFEHLLLLAQAMAGVAMGARTSIGGLFFARIELHFFYNLMVLVPMILGLWKFDTQSKHGDSR